MLSHGQQVARGTHYGYFRGNLDAIALGVEAVGPAHSRGVAGVISGGTRRGSLEGAGSITQRVGKVFGRTQRRRSECQT